MIFLSPYNQYFQKVKSSCRGYARLIRYVDDYVSCFQDGQDASELMQEMEQRLKTFHFKVAPEKAKQLEFGFFAQLKAKSRGKRKCSVIPYQLK